MASNNNNTITMNFNSFNDAMPGFNFFDPPPSGPRGDPSIPPFNGSSPFLALPAELRMRIYEEALVPPPDHNNNLNLHIPNATNTIPPLPPLLSVSRLIRKEALIPYISTTDIQINITNCNASLLHQYERGYRLLWKRYANRKATVINKLGVCFLRPKLRNWANLMQWCEWIFREKLVGVPIDSGDGQYDAFIKVVSGAHAIAYQHRTDGLTWDQCKKALETMRYVIGAFDQDWLN